MERNRRRKLAKENVNRSKTRQQKISIQTQYSEINKRANRSIRKDKRNWINEQAKLAEEAERKGDIRELEPSGFELPSREAIFPLPPLSSFLSLLRIVWSLAAVDIGEGGAGA